MGFKQAVDSGTEENKKVIFELLKQIRCGKNNNCTARINTTESITEIQIEPIVSTFSDFILIAILEELFNGILSLRHAIVEILNIIQQLSNFAIQKGFLIRGGISIGYFLYDDCIPFGKAYNDAYMLESKEAVYPRILASQEVVDCFNSDKKWGTKEYFLKDDIDGRYYLDYLPAAFTDPAQIDVYRKIIQAKIAALMNDPIKDEHHKRILDKWLWFKNYFQYTIDKITINNACC
ncbi:hypothetical protein [Rickettsiella endosymbiont of Dermanyssus gallinae]|uniref:hypothetical protein n=1 Tax=Rickettsiella endosymbiont of Dermanyssus gallinae TaxID=2856608 RepID=UPI001C52CEBB|nr:hypothetical protein [Rickettsiella endosymbiont of Dermanyssus gallinae]